MPVKQVPNIGILWLRQDLRIADNPALRQALAECEQLILLYIDDPATATQSTVGAASRVWLHHSLESLARDVALKGGSLHFAQGDSLAVLHDLIEQTAATHLYWNRCYDPLSIERDTHIKAKLASRVLVQSFNALLLFEPFDVLKTDGTPYRVYTPFWRMLTQRFPADTPLAAPRILPPAMNILGVSQDVASLALLPKLNWHLGVMAHWQVGEKAARSALKTFLKNAVNQYQEQRDHPAEAGTSRMSPHLHFGEISPRQIVQGALDGRVLDDLSSGELTFIKEIVWREFAYSLLFHFPHTIETPLDQRFERFGWADNYAADLHAWRIGQTGVPIVDAGMRELYATGWMHNRVRMIVGSYLIKNLLIPWQEGERWFRETLVDADLACNVMGWQWCAGSGADAAPFFRIFNPILQGEKFDKAGGYVRRWVPELRSVDAKFIHKPWELSEKERAILDYPEPLVDLKVSRTRALEAFAAIKGT